MNQMETLQEFVDALEHYTATVDRRWRWDRAVVVAGLVLILGGASSWGQQLPAWNPTRSDNNSNTAGGTGVLPENRGSYNTAFGGATLSNPSSTARENTAIGYNALHFNATGSFNTAIGVGALQSTQEPGPSPVIGPVPVGPAQTGRNNAAVGWSALWRNTSGDDNSALGSEALRSNTSGDNNAALGGGRDASIERRKRFVNPVFQGRSTSRRSACMHNGNHLR